MDVVGFALLRSQQRENYKMHQGNEVKLVELEVVELKGVQLKVIELKSEELG